MIAGDDGAEVVEGKNTWGWACPRGERGARRRESRRRSCEVLLPPLRLEHREGPLSAQIIQEIRCRHEDRGV